MLLAAYAAGSLLTVSVLLSYLATHLATLIASVLTYRLSPLHPLACYPGPFWCRTSKLWHACLAYSGEHHKYLQALHARYGDVVRIGESSCSATIAVPIDNWY